MDVLGKLYGFSKKATGSPNHLQFPRFQSRSRSTISTMPVERFVEKRGRNVAGQILTSALTGTFVVFSLLALAEGKWFETSLCAVVAMCFLGIQLYWERDGRLHWVEVDNDGLRYLQGRKIVTIRIDESIQLERPEWKDGNGAGVWLILTSPYGKVSLDERLESVDRLVKLICEKWELGEVDGGW